MGEIHSRSSGKGEYSACEVITYSLWPLASILAADHYVLLLMFRSSFLSFLFLSA